MARCPAHSPGAADAAGEHLTVCDGQGTDYACQIAAFEGEGVRLSVLSQAPSCTEPSLAVTLYQGLPKGDKMDWILQKAVELGVTAVVPLATSRSVVRLDGKEEKKRERWQRIAAEAAGQCGRGIVPRVESPLSFAQALPLLRKDKTICFYEGGGQPFRGWWTPEKPAFPSSSAPRGALPRRRSPPSGRRAPLSPPWDPGYSAVKRRRWPP